ncbi:MAG: hypothetical protein EOO05_19105 [Chitinophagaceae bacterium]|nr:MAG: hypothetical protein EOO05_19105 [Chitinophagaceae bacterium]
MGLCLGCSLACRGQTYAEFFRQKRTQERYLLNQILALKVYGEYLQKGYSLVSGGLDVVRELSGGEFRLHELFISSLKLASPVVRKSPKVAEIVSMQLSIAGMLSRMRMAGREELLRDLREGMLLEMAGDLEELLLVISSGKLEMGEGERLERIDRLHGSMLERYRFVRSMAGELKVMEKQGGLEARDNEKSRRLYGID